MTAYWHVSDIRDSLEQLIDAGAKEVRAASDVGGGKLIASVQDQDGNIIGLMQAP
jgi:predicted enzyme related to lactoylglutathione lyase